MFDEHIAPVLEAEAKHKLLGHTYGVSMVWKDFFPVYTQLQNDYPEIYIKNAATPPEAEEERSKVKEIKVDIVVQGTTKREAEEKMEAFMAEYKRRIDAAGGGSHPPNLAPKRFTPRGDFSADLYAVPRLPGEGVDNGGGQAR